MIKGQEMELRTNKELGLLRKNVHYLRKEANKLSLDALALELKLSRDTLFKLENKTDAIPNLMTVLKISCYFEVPISDLLEKDLEVEDNKLLGKVGI